MAEIAQGLNSVIGDVTGLIVSVYWPFRGEPDLRAWMKQVTARGGRCALPVVVEKGQQLIFRCWADGESLERGVWNIPIPAAGPSVVPGVTFAPIVGFDPQCFRLGYGGGFFDRTLASLPKKPRVFGVGYELQAIHTIHPLPHEISMNAIITEKDVHRPTTITINQGGNVAYRVAAHKAPPASRDLMTGYRI